VAVPLVLDTDIGTDVDDALALAFALRHPDIDLRAVTTVSGDPALRARLAAKLLRLAGRDDVEVAAGIGAGEMPAAGTMGHEGIGLLAPGENVPFSERGAVDVLLTSCADAAPTCEIATVGMQSNVAAAVARDPDFASRVRRLAVMGGVFPPADVAPAADHNLNTDAPSSIAALSAGFRILYVPLNVTQQTYLTRSHLERLRAGDALCRALAALVDVWAPILQRVAPDIPDDYVSVLHDPLTVACVVDDRLVTSKSLPVTVAEHDGRARTFVDPLAGRKAEVITSVDASSFADLWLETVLG
jgi:purine nucleosidase